MANSDIRGSGLASVIVSERIPEMLSKVALCSHGPRVSSTGVVAAQRRPGDIMYLYFNGFYLWSVKLEGSKGQTS